MVLNFNLSLAAQVAQLGASELGDSKREDENATC